MVRNHSYAWGWCFNHMKNIRRGKLFGVLGLPTGRTHTDVWSMWRTHVLDSFRIGTGTWSRDDPTTHFPRPFLFTPSCGRNVRRPNSSSWQTDPWHFPGYCKVECTCLMQAEKENCVKTYTLHVMAKTNKETWEKEHWHNELCIDEDGRIKPLQRCDGLPCSESREGRKLQCH